MERDRHLRLVGEKGPPLVARAALPSQQLPPPEHASPEAKLKWARQQRELGGDATKDAARTAKLDKDFSSLSFAAGSGPKTKPVIESDPEPAVDSKSWKKVGIFSVLAALLLLVAVYFVLGDRQVVPVLTADLPPNALPQPPDVAFASLGPMVLDSYLPVPLVPGRTGISFPLGNAEQVADPDVDIVGAKAMVGLMLVPEQPNASVDMAFASVLPANSAAITRFSDVAMPSSDVVEANFVQPIQYSREELGEGANALLRLIAGGEVAKPIAETPTPTATKPLIFVRHGLGVSPDTVRLVMQRLSGAGYESVFQIGVPFRIGRTNIRYYHEADLGLAKTVADTVIPLVEGPQFTAPRDFSQYAKPPVAGTIDVWLSDKS